MHAAPDSDYRPLLDLCNNSDVSKALDLTWAEYDAIHKNLAKLFVIREDIFGVLYALNRDLPNVWKDRDGYSIRSREHARVEDSIDEAMIVLRKAKIFYYRFYMMSQ
ncbi:hypothetical protein MMC34_004148 [Xylographa carneopallida]|nr:hypothetical protein [Xylographa carneopallida]